MRIRAILKRKLPGSTWEIGLSPWVILFWSLLIYIVAAVGATIIKSILILFFAFESARTAAVSPNLIDPGTGQNVQQEFVNKVQNIVTVNSTDLTDSPSPVSTNVQIGDLDLNMYTSDGNYVTTSMVYGIQLPGSALFNRLSFTPSAIPVYLPPISFYREW